MNNLTLGLYGNAFFFYFFFPTGDMTRLLFFPKYRQIAFMSRSIFTSSFVDFFIKEKKLYLHTQTFFFFGTKVFNTFLFFRGAATASLRALWKAC